MAIVKITDTLIHDVVRNVATLLDDEISDARDQRPDLGLVCLERVLEPYKEQIDATPPLWLIPCDKVYLCFDGNIEQYDLTPPVLAPLRLEATDMYDYRVGDSYVTIQLKSPVMWRAELDAFKRWGETIIAMVSKQRAAKDNTEAILVKFNTLAPALKAWPALWDLLPNSYRDRHRAVSERRVRPAPIDAAKELEGLSGITAALTAAKMGVK
jgi:hypothetical protein